MPTEKDLIRRLINELMECEKEMKSLHLVIAAMRQANPDFPALALLAEARLHPQFRTEAQERYRPLLEAMEHIDAQELLAKMPPSKYLH
jgi:hypothetical protein